MKYWILTNLNYKHGLGMSENQHIEFMTRALELARKGEGLASPNPMVGAVVLKDGEILLR